ncbi:MAG: MFS transporter [Dehalococcoidia bacterium]
MSASIAAVTDVLTGRRRVFFGWWLLAASVCAMALGSGTSFWAFGFYVQPLEREFGWSRAEVSLGFSAALLTSGLSGPLVGRFIDTRGPRSAIIVGAVLTALSFLLLATTDALWQWYLYSSINAVSRQLMFFIPFMALISRWFDRRRGIAVSILGTGFSLGGFIVVPFVQLAMEALGWRATLVGSGLAVALVFLPIGVFIVRNTPAEIGLGTDGAREADGSASPPRAVDGVTLGDAMRSPLFWALSLGFMLFFYGMFGWMVHQVPFYESVGLSRGTAATIVSATAALSIGTRLLVGMVADRITRFELVVVALASTLMLGMVTLSVSTSAPAIALFLVLWVVGTAGGPMIESLLLTRAFGLKHFGAILGSVVVVETVGQILSPTIAGAIFDATGAYRLALYMFMGTFATAAAMFLVASRMRRPYEPAVRP